MNGRLQEYFELDHRRLGGLLDTATGSGGPIDLHAYDQFRAGLLRHIGLEEKILLPAYQRLNGGTPYALAARIRLDHGAIAALLVPFPTPALVRALRGVLSRHDELEEGPEGMYRVIETVDGLDADATYAQVMQFPPVPPHPYQDPEKVIDAIRRALARAGFDFDALAAG